MTPLGKSWGMVEKWTENLKVGDKVIMIRTIYGKIASYQVCKVERITKIRKELVVGGRRFDRFGRSEYYELMEYNEENLLSYVQWTKKRTVEKWLEKLNLDNNPFLVGRLYDLMIIVKGEDSDDQSKTDRQ